VPSIFLKLWMSLTLLRLSAITSMLSGSSVSAMTLSFLYSWLPSHWWRRQSSCSSCHSCLRHGGVQSSCFGGASSSLFISILLLRWCYQNESQFGICVAPNTRTMGLCGEGEISGPRAGKWGHPWIFQKIGGQTTYSHFLFHQEFPSCPEDSGAKGAHTFSPALPLIPQAKAAVEAMAGGAHGFRASSMWVFLLLRFAKNVSGEHHSLSGWVFFCQNPMYLFLTWTVLNNWNSQVHKSTSSYIVLLRLIKIRISTVFFSGLRAGQILSRRPQYIKTHLNGMHLLVRILYCETKNFLREMIFDIPLYDIVLHKLLVGDQYVRLR
jgi:hypothetical protein